MKHVYRVLIFLLVFLGSVTAFSGTMKETKGAGKVKSISLREPTFPVMTVRTQGYDINVLHGYNSNLKASINRESMTPVGSDRQFQLVIAENETSVRKIRYELRKVNDNEQIDYGESSVLEDTKEGKVATITLDTSIEQGKEYAFKVTAVTKEGKKIHYFTHIKYYGADSFLKEKMKFIKEFHDNTLDKSKMDEVSKYLEISYTNSNDDFAKVDITSNADMVTWGNLEPKIVSQVVPTVKEFNIETAAVSMEYYVKLKSKEGNQLCRVKEFLRVRYSGGRMYLLKYDRDMDTLFSMENTNTSTKQFKIGITDPSFTQVEYSPEEHHMAFVQAGELWKYSLVENTAVRVFSFKGESEDYLRAAYDQHNVRIINVDDEGNINFMVYGYMNTGDYEGCVGVIWYKYYEAEKRMEEQVFIPMETTYQILKEDLDSFCYVSEADVFYFSVKNVIYCYDAVAKEVKVIAKNVSEGDYCFVTKSGLLAWQSNSDDSQSKEVVLMNLDNKNRKSIKAKENERILLIGSIDENVVYGLSKESDMKEQADGSMLTPMYKVCISDKTGKVPKEYKRSNMYVSSATVENDVVKLKLVQKVGSTFVDNKKSDSIQNQMAGSIAREHVIKKNTETNLAEYYITIAGNSVMDRIPSVTDVKNTVIRESKIVRLDGMEADLSRYYVYAEGVILDAYANPAKAITVAEDYMGVVVNDKNQVVYERAGKYTNNQIGNVNSITAQNGINTKGACVAMVCNYAHVDGDTREMSKSEKSAYSLLKKAMGETAEVVNLKGCTLDEVLYFVSGNRPVIALTSSNTFVLITEYTESTVSYINPITGKKETKGITAMANVFEAAGNAFVSYVQ